jgi:hypothetical protein
MVEFITPRDVRALERRAFAVQFVAACLYALGLAPLRRFYEKYHLTELTVIGGVLLSVAPARWLARQAPATSSQYEGIPITAWQVWLFVRRLRRREGA